MRNRTTILALFVAALLVLGCKEFLAAVAAGGPIAGQILETAADVARARGADEATVAAIAKLEKKVAEGDDKIAKACKAKATPKPKKQSPTAAKLAADAAEDAEAVKIRAENAALRAEIAGLLARLEARAVATPSLPPIVDADAPAIDGGTP